MNYLNDPLERLLLNLECNGGNKKVLFAMGRVRRDLFVLPGSTSLAYEDIALPIDDGQTISQPSIVAIMTSALELRGYETVLEIGTGSGYQAAVLSLMLPEGNVISVERIPALAKKSTKLLSSLGYENVEVIEAGPRLGCPEYAPYGAIIVTAASPSLPAVLLDQLQVGGRIIIPVGTRDEQNLVLAEKRKRGICRRNLGSCRFVPLIGEEAWHG